MNRSTAIGVGSVVVLVALSAYAVSTQAWKLLVVSWAAFAAMAFAAPFGARSRTEHAEGLVWGYGLASGAMVTSAAVFLVPQAIGHHPQFGGFGIAFGILAGFGAHTVGHRFAHMDFPMDRTVTELSAHAVSAGAIIGIVYGNIDVGVGLGLAIVSHKGPAGYAAARRLAGKNKSVYPLLLPAAGLGIAAIVSSAVSLPATAAFRGIVFGFASGVFLHVAMDFLPRCEIGSEIHDLLSVEDEHAHTILDRLRVHAAISTVVGGGAVFAAWLLLG
ncbi:MULTISPECIES: ZIP family metal transporter [Haloferax]|uniref:ZIP family metal transporter n=1 Tax=Haloferax marinum TaxID=2666143 RepID=A0A6A8GC97_9EURY|nr:MULTISPECIES: ZIP family metal transporter [Haloferax]KAB1198557.1 ZIP family metal transporter [Haloferax sp. CBA1150]MRW97666.1 ZIP family metal transporter [Haloferax marinum]